MPMLPVIMLASSRKNIAEHVLRHDHVKLGRVFHDLHGRVVHTAYQLTSTCG